MEGGECVEAVQGWENERETRRNGTNDKVREGRRNNVVVAISEVGKKEKRTIGEIKESVRKE